MTVVGVRRVAASFEREFSRLPDLQGGYLYVLAGNHDQYVRWVLEHDPPFRTRYIATHQNLYGTYMQFYVRVGTIWDRPDIAAIEEELLITQAIEVEVCDDGFLRVI